MISNHDNYIIQKDAKKIITKYELCDCCLGRLFSRTDLEYKNEEIGKKLKKKLKYNKKIEVKDCWLCNGLIDEISHFSDLVITKLKEYEYNTFLIGTIIDEDIIEKEQILFDQLECKYYESIKNELNREIGKILEARIDKEVDFEKPDIMIVIDTQFDIIDLQISSLYIYGRYNKYDRKTPQTKWFCKICRGIGCKRCNYSGRLYENSIEELISIYFLKETKGNDESFHGCGREDIDVRMLGDGRPFVLEIKNPKKRNINLTKIMNQINKENKDLIKINDLKFTNKDEIIRIKNSKFTKKYRMKIKCEKQINIEKLKKVAKALHGQRISQYTPSRVAHRRANMVRERTIYCCHIEAIDETIAILTIKAESGTYIKELVSGDDEKTKPSISGLIKVPCVVEELDVIEIKEA